METLKVSLRRNNLKREITMTQIIKINDPLSLQSVWGDNVKTLLNKSVELSKGECSLDSIYDDLMNNKETLLLVFNNWKLIAVSLIRIITYSTGYRVLNISSISGGGDIEHWGNDLLDYVNNIALSEGVTEIKAVGIRKGWLRYFKNNTSIENTYNVFSYKVKET